MGDEVVDTFKKDDSDEPDDGRGGFGEHSKKRRAKGRLRSTASTNKKSASQGSNRKRKITGYEVKVVNVLRELYNDDEFEKVYEMFFEGVEIVEEDVELDMKKLPVEEDKKKKPQFDGISFGDLDHDWIKKNLETIKIHDLKVISSTYGDKHGRHAEGKKSSRQTFIDYIRSTY